MPITNKTSAGKIIGDFEKSDDPKFSGDSAEQRKKRALGAYYKMHPEKSKKMQEDVQSFVSHTIDGNKEEALAVFQEVLMDKIAARMETMKMDVAQQIFGFGEARNKFDDEDESEKDDKKKGEEVRKARRVKAQGKYQKPEIEESVGELTEAIKQGDKNDKDWEDMSHGAKELVLHAENTHQLHTSSWEPIVKNLKKKVAKGTYDRSKVPTLTKYHADRAAQSYAKEHGDKHTPWHEMFDVEDRNQAAHHFANTAHAEAHED